MLRMGLRKEAPVQRRNGAGEGGIGREETIENLRKRKLLNVLLALMFLAGFLILAYPTISDQWNTYRQSRLSAVMKM